MTETIPIKRTYYAVADLHHDDIDIIVLTPGGEECVARRKTIWRRRQAMTIWRTVREPGRPTRLNGGHNMTDATLKFQAPPAPKVRQYSPSARGNDDLCDVNDAALALGISRASLDRQLARKGSPVPRPFRVGGKRLWLRRDLEQYVLAKALLARTRSSPDHE